MNASQVTQDGDGRDILSVECEYTGSLRAKVGGALGWRDVAMYMFVMHIICSCDLGQKPSDHLDDLRDRHGANLILSLLRSRSGSVGAPRSHQIFTGETLNMGQALDTNATR